MQRKALNIIASAVLSLLILGGCAESAEKPETHVSADGDIIVTKDDKPEPPAADTVNSGETGEVSVSDESSEGHWGLTLSVKDVTPSGLTIVFTQSNGEPAKELNTGSYFCIDRFINGAWEPVKPIPSEEELGWDSILYIINHGGETEIEESWTYIYGNLPEGKYRIGKEIMDFTDAGDYDSKMYYSEFDIESEPEKWGLTLSVKDVAPSGLTIVFAQSKGEPTGELNTGSYFCLDKFINGVWARLNLFRANMSLLGLRKLIPSPLKPKPKCRRLGYISTESFRKEDIVSAKKLWISEKPATTT